jgi:hypothetical protein
MRGTFSGTSARRLPSRTREAAPMKPLVFLIPLALIAVAAGIYLLIGALRG